MGTKRKLIPKGINHVYNRGNNRIDIFHSNKDRYVFLRNIKEAKEDHGIEVYAYCLMDNHYHIEVSGDNENLPDAMRDIQSNYAKYHNKKNDFKGHLFQGPYQNSEILTDASFFRVMRYILRNPVKAGLTDDIYSYYWSSSLFQNDKYKLVNFNYNADAFSKTFDNDFCEYMNSDCDDKLTAKIELCTLNDEDVASIYNEILIGMGISDNLKVLSEENVEKLVNYCRYRNFNRKQISQSTGLSLYKIDKIKKLEMEYL